MTTQNLIALDPAALAPVGLREATDPARAARLSRYGAIAGRWLLGALFFVFGLNGFLNFIPPPSEPMPERAMSFGAALFQTGYMFPLIKGTEAVCGALLLLDRFVPLALVVLAPIVVNIFAFHAVLTPGDAGIASVVVALQCYVAWTRREAFRPLLRAR